MGTLDWVTWGSPRDSFAGIASHLLLTMKSPQWDTKLGKKFCLGFYLKYGKQNYEYMPATYFNTKYANSYFTNCKWC